MRGYRNKWKSVVSHLSVNELDGSGSFEYDMHALILINFIISGLETVEEKTDERRLLNSLQFNQTLEKLQTSINDTMSNVDTAQPATPSDEVSVAGYTPINSQTGNTMYTNLISLFFVQK